MNTVEIDVRKNEFSSGEYFSEILQRQRLAFERNRFPSMQERVRHLKTLTRLLHQNRQLIISALNEDFGHRSGDETRIAEIGGSVANVEYAARHLAKWMRSRGRGTSIWFLPGANRVMPQPLGVVGIMVPWNYPINLAISPLASALAAGNRAMIKMSEFTPASTRVLAQIIANEFDANHIAVLDGDAGASAEFASLPFDHLLFTGSTNVGRKVMAAAAQNLTPVTLELGGKSPVIIDKDYRIEEAAHRILWGKTFNAGQTCVAPDYVLLPKGSMDDFVIWMSRHFRGHFPMGALSEDYTSIIDKRNYDRLNNLIQVAEETGSKVVRMEETTSQHVSERKLPLTLILNPSFENRVMKEEIFGPVLPVIEVDHLSTALKKINESERPLALYYFGHSEKNQGKVMCEAHAGGVTVNDVMLQYLQVSQPFGGVGASGFGNYHGREGFETFSHMKPVFKQRGMGSFTGLKLLYPPYGALARRLISLMGG